MYHCYGGYIDEIPVVFYYWRTFELFYFWVFLETIWTTFLKSGYEILAKFFLPELIENELLAFILKVFRFLILSMLVLFISGHDSLRSAICMWTSSLARSSSSIFFLMLISYLSLSALWALYLSHTLLSLI